MSDYQIGQTRQVKVVRAVVTATNVDGKPWGWPGQRVIRYECEDGSWAWVPGDEELGAVIEVDDAERPEYDDTYLDGHGEP